MNDYQRRLDQIFDEHRARTDKIFDDARNAMLVAGGAVSILMGLLAGLLHWWLR